MKNLNFKKGNYDAFMKVSPIIKEYLDWWIGNIETSFKPVQIGNPHFIIETDSSDDSTEVILSSWRISTRKTYATYIKKWFLFTQMIHQYDKDPKSCIVHTFREYLDRTAALRGKVTKLLVTTQKPHPAASRDTVSRWVKSLLTSAGVDKCFKPHSVRSASVSKAKDKGVKLETILKSAGWSNARTFARFYNKPIADDHSFENAILNNC
ncbi:hypothetical protein MAR_022128 [Mya arenaria]|uniref:Tyr recombinase domain-containing protein n=1 Tax=Mya arenaria TaxID=6604 RepID=A0ABY7DM42_MYAAR|nr:hypothetical protein MAR_022128 [Mya arenaria]